MSDPRRRTKTGAVIGYLAGLTVMLADCGGRSTCGEQDLRPALGILLGGIAGAMIAERWVGIPWP